MLNIFHRHHKTEPPVSSTTVDSSEHLQHLDALVMKRIQNAALDRWQKPTEPPALNRANSAEIPTESQRSRTRRNVSRTVSHNSCRRGTSTAAARLGGYTKKSRTINNALRHANDDSNTASTHSTRPTVRTPPRATRSAHTRGSHSSRTRPVVPAPMLDIFRASTCSSRGERNSTPRPRRVYKKSSKSKSRPETKKEKTHAEEHVKKSTRHKESSTRRPLPTSSTRRPRKRSSAA